MVDGQCGLTKAAFPDQEAAVMKSKSIDTVSRSSWFHLPICNWNLKLINAKDYGLVWLQPVGISDTIAQGGSKIRNESIIHKPKK